MSLVSVVVPFYNDHAYLSETLESFFSQTYENLELILVDDCSTTPPQLPTNSKYPVRLLRTMQRSGPGHARNLGVKEANGDFIAFLDSDDLWMPTKIEKQLALFSKHPDAGWTYTDALYIKNGKKFSRPHSKFVDCKDGLPSGSAINAFHLRGYNYITMSCTMMKKSVLEELGGFNESLTVAEDWDLYARLAERSLGYAVNQPLCYYRLKPSGRAQTNLDQYISVNIDILQSLYQRQGLLPAKDRELQQALAVIYERAGIQYLNKGAAKQARSMLFHACTKSKKYELKLVALRAFSLLPSIFYRSAVKLLSLLP